MTPDGSADIRSLAAGLEAAVARSVAGGDRPVVLYSGGLDSSVLAWCLRARRPLLATVGTVDAPDRVAARSGAHALGLPLVETTVSRSVIGAALRRWSDEVGPLREPLRSVVVTEAIALETAPPGRLVFGQGADELFHGYAHFRPLDPEAAARRAARDLALLVDQEWPRVERIARALGREAVAPFLDRGFLQEVRRYPGSHRVPDGAPTKPVLREVARALGLPPVLVDRPKRAMQYGSGVHRLVRREPPADGGPD